MSVNPSLQALAMAMSTVCIHVFGDVPSAPLVGFFQVSAFTNDTVTRVYFFRLLRFKWDIFLLVSKVVKWVLFKGEYKHVIHLLCALLSITGLGSKLALDVPHFNIHILPSCCHLGSWYVYMPYFLALSVQTTTSIRLYCLVYMFDFMLSLFIPSRFVMSTHPLNIFYTFYSEILNDLIVGVAGMFFFAVDGETTGTKNSSEARLLTSE